ncbi:MAG: hypothetical protein Tsb0020_44470 [Haliangiales bacterium]
MLLLRGQLEGQQVDSFKIGRQLGAGAMGVVYLAKDLQLRREVAIKFIAKQRDDDELIQQRFLREARAAARLIHPNVVQIFQIGETPELRYIAMEYVPGMSARELAKQHGGRVPPQLAVPKLREAADALALADSLGICHQDIKPANLLITTNHILKIADFGLATQIDGSDSIGSSSRDGIQGTPYYMSPEQWQGQEISPAVDIYSLGCTFYALLAGEPPYGRRDIMGSMRGHCTEAVPTVLDLVPDVAPRLAALLQVCMAKKPQERPRARSLIAALDELGYDDPPEARHLRRSARYAAVPTLSPAPAPQLDRFEGVDRPSGLGADSAPADPIPDGIYDEPLTAQWPERHHANTEHSEFQPVDSDVDILAETSQSSLASGSHGSYQLLFALNGHPFSEIRQPEHFWDQGPYGWALRALTSQLQAGASATMLLGPEGSGRTFLCDTMAQRAPNLQLFRVEPQLLFGDPILVALCRQYSLDVRPDTSTRLLVQAFLNQTTANQPGRRVALVIDSFDPEDDELAAEVQALLRLTASTPLSLVLIGDPDCLAHFPSYDGAPPVTLRPMNRDEMLEYINFRLLAIGGAADPLTLDLATQQLLCARSGGIPRLVNIFCHNALTIAAVKGHTELSFELFRLGMKSNQYLNEQSARELLAKPR